MKELKTLIDTDLQKQIDKQDLYTDFIYSFMYLDRKKHRVWAVVRQHNLTILTDNPYLGTQLRYQQETIQNAVNQHFLLELKQTKIKIIQPKAEPVLKPDKLFVMSENTKSTLETLAEGIEDNDLRDALLKLTDK